MVREKGNMRILKRRPDLEPVRKHVTEHTVIFISVLKWVVLATFIGIIVGVSTAIFLKILEWGIGFSGQFHYYFLLLPAALILSSLLVKRLAPDAEGHGTEKVIEAVHKYSGKIKAQVVPVKLVATVITVALGGSVGKEGPCAQIGAGLSSIIADLFRFNNRDRKRLVICGISAGFAAVFGTPIAGAIFGVEVLFVGSILYEVLLPSFIAGITAYQVAVSLGIKYTYVPMNFVPVFSSSFFLEVILSGVFFGLCAMLLIEAMKLSERLAHRLRLSFLLKAALGGIVLVGLTFLFTPRYLGLGLETVRATLQGEKVAWYAFLVKTVFTSITLSFGGSGGIVTPIFFVGTTAGSLWAGLLHLPQGAFAAIGMVALLAGAANTPIAASIMAVEFFGTKIVPYAALACVISFLITGHRSVYPSQILTVRKSPTVQVELGVEMEDVKPVADMRRSSIIRSMLRTFGLIQQILRRDSHDDSD
jgi:chloride channel protein, CIC family